MALVLLGGIQPWREQTNGPGRLDRGNFGLCRLWKVIHHVQITEVYYFDGSQVARYIIIVGAEFLQRRANCGGCYPKLRTRPRARRRPSSSRIRMFDNQTNWTK